MAIDPLGKLSREDWHLVAEAQTDTAWLGTVTRRLAEQCRRYAESVERERTSKAFDTEDKARFVANLERVASTLEECW